MLNIQGQNGNDDVYEQMDPNKQSIESMGFNVSKINEKVRNLNWHDQHIKTDLDSKITPLCQAAYLGRRRIIEMMLENYTYLDLNLATKENCYTPISSACMAGNYEIV